MRRSRCSRWADARSLTADRRRQYAVGEAERAGSEVPLTDKLETSSLEQAAEDSARRVSLRCGVGLTTFRTGAWETPGQFPTLTAQTSLAPSVRLRRSSKV
jgi:hypothetical protein